MNKRRTYENLLQLALMARNDRVQKVYLKQLPWEGFK
jgi:hypothetical protein